LDDMFVARGYYDNIASGEQNFDGTNLSQLFPVQNDEWYPQDSGTTVHVWQGYRKNWVSESGVTYFASGLTAPTLASGVYVDGVFHGRRTPNNTDGISMDFRNGRVILESGVAASSTLEIAYSVKEVWVDTIARDMVTNQVTVIDNTKRIAVSNVPSGQIGNLPMILMDISSQQPTYGLELGGGKVINPSMFLHVVAENRYDKDEIVDALVLRQFKTITMVDLDTAPAQFNYYGDYESTYAAYGTLTSTYRDRYAYIENVSLISNDDIAQEGYYTALLRFDFRLDITEEV